MQISSEHDTTEGKHVMEKNCVGEPSPRKGRTLKETRQIPIAVRTTARKGYVDMSAYGKSGGRQKTKEQGEELQKAECWVQGELKKT